MIAVFCRYQRDFEELGATPENMFVRVKSPNDICGRSFIGIIKCHQWYYGDRKMMEAHDELQRSKPELFR